MDIKQVFDLVLVEYVGDKRLQAIFKYYANRERDPRNSRTILKYIHDALKNQFSTDALQEAFLELESLNCGKFHKGRPRQNGSFEWYVSPRELAHQLVDENRETQNGGSAPDLSATIETFPFPVRPGITLPIPIRCDMTTAELNNLAEFVKVIAASRINDGTRRVEASHV